MATDKDHLLTLKVMKLTRPSLSGDLPSERGQLIHLDPLDVNSTQDPFYDTNINNVNTVQETPYETFSSALLLPQSFQNVHLGEKFLAYISVHNPSKVACRSLQVKIEVQTTQQRLNLLPDTSPQPSKIAEIPPGQCVNYIVQYDVREIGTHILSCHVVYINTLTNKQELLKKYYKFSVNKPLDYRFSVTDLPNGSFFYEVGIRNTKLTGLYLEKVLLIPTKEYLCEDLNTHSSDDNGDVLDRYLSPMESYQLLFKLNPNPNHPLSKIKQIGAKQPPPQIGYLDVHWSISMCEPGREYLTLLGKNLPAQANDLQIQVVKLDSHTELEKPTDITIQLTNRSERVLVLRVELNNDNTSGITWTGISGRNIGNLEQNQSTKLHFTFLPTKPGLQDISGLRVIDLFLKRPIDYGKLSSIFVEIPY